MPGILMLATSVPVLGVSPGSGCVSLLVTGVFSTGCSGACTGLVGVGAGSAFAFGFTASALVGFAGAALARRFGGRRRLGRPGHGLGRDALRGRGKRRGDELDRIHRRAD